MRLFRFLVVAMAFPLVEGCAGGLYSSFFFKSGAGSSRTVSPPPQTTVLQPSAQPQATSGASAVETPATPALSLPPANETVAPSPRATCRQVVTDGMDAVFRSHIITEDATLSGRVLVEGHLTVAPQATLTIAPGTVLRFRTPDSGALNAPLPALLVEGRLVVKGTPAQPVLFTSSCASPSAGEWQGIILIGSEKRNILEGIRIEGAVTGLDILFSHLTVRQLSVSASGTGIRLQESLAVVSSATLRDIPLSVDLVGADLEMKDSTVTGGRTGIRAVSTSLYLADSSLSGQEMEGLAATDCRIKLQGNTITGNGIGVVIAGCQGSLSGNRINENHRYGLQLQGSPLRVSGNEFARNGLSGIRAADGRAVAWGNALIDNGRFDLELQGSHDFRAPANWWQMPPEQIEGRINDGRRQQGLGTVLFTPPLARRPALAPAVETRPAATPP